MNYKELAEMEHVGDAIDVLKTVGQSAGDALVNKIEVETTLFKDSESPFSKSSEKGKGVLGKILRPKFTIYNNMGQEEKTIAPYGEPKEISGIVKGGAIAFGLAGAALIFGAGRLSKRAR